MPKHLITLKKIIDREVLPRFKEKAPYRFGGLREAIKTKIEGNAVLIFVDPNASAPAEYGVKHLKPHQYGAILDSKSRWWDKIEDKLEDDNSKLTRRIKSKFKNQYLGG